MHINSLSCALLFGRPANDPCMCEYVCVYRKREQKLWLTDTAHAFLFSGWSMSPFELCINFYFKSIEESWRIKESRSSTKTIIVSVFCERLTLISSLTTRAHAHTSQPFAICLHILLGTAAAAAAASATASLYIFYKWCKLHTKHITCRARATLQLKLGRSLFSAIIFIKESIMQKFMQEN